MIEENGCFGGVVEEKGNVGVVIVMVFREFRGGVVGVENGMFLERYRVE